MSRGGYRPGAGRPKGAKNKSPNWDRIVPRIQSEALLSDLTPLEYMLTVMRDPSQDPARRDRLAIAAAPYVHHRIADERIRRKDEAEKAAKKAGEGRFAVPAAPKLGLVISNN
jgi:phage terminase small subunit